MTSKETVQRCRRCNSAIPDGGQMLCMGVQPIALIDDVTDDDCPKRRGAPEALANKKRPGRKPKVTKEPEAKVALPDSRTDSDRFGQIWTGPVRSGAQDGGGGSDPPSKPLCLERWAGEHRDRPGAVPGIRRDRRISDRVRHQVHLSVPPEKRSAGSG